MSRIFLFFFLVLSLESLAQEDQRMDSLTPDELYAQIRRADHVEHMYIGCYGAKSEIYGDVTQLRILLGDKLFSNFIYDSSYILKYYAFVTLIKFDDSAAYEYLKENIKDTTPIEILFAGSGISPETIPFNQLLMEWYYLSVKLKYEFGGSFTCMAEVLVFPPKNKKKWKEKRREFESLVEENGITPSTTFADGF